MNATKVLSALVLVLLAVVGFMVYKQGQSPSELQEIRRMLEAGGDAAVQPTEPTDVATLPPAEQVEEAAAEDESEAAGPDPEIAAELAALRAELEAMRTEKDLLSEENRRMQGEIDARLRRIRSAPMLTSVTNVFAEHGLVVIGAGSRQNLEAGDEFSIRRDDRIVARVQVVEVDEVESAAVIVPGSIIVQDNPEIAGGDGAEVVEETDMGVRVGDEVVQLN